jgi:hypothetical protein
VVQNVEVRKAKKSIWNQKGREHLEDLDISEDSKCQ